jgi:hypothetical protein
MGATTFTKATAAQTGGQRHDYVVDNKRVVKGTITFSASYATGGDSLALGTTGLKEVTGILIDPSMTTNQSGLSVALGGTKTAPVILAYDANATQVANATDLSARAAIPVWLLGS